MKTKKKTLKQKIKSQKRKKKSEAKSKDIAAALEKNPFSWVSIGDDWCLSCNKDIEFWIIKSCGNYALIQFEVNECIVSSISEYSFCLLDAFSFHEEYLRKELDRNGSFGFFGYKNAKWRLVPASSSQKYLLKTGGVSFSNDISKGDACNLLTKLYSVAPKIDEDYYIQTSDEMPKSLLRDLLSGEGIILSEEPIRESIINKDHYSEFALAEEARQKDVIEASKATPIENPRKQMMEKLDIWNKEKVESIFKLEHA